MEMCENPKTYFRKIMRKCVVPGCKTREKNKDPNITLFTFPNDPELKNEWYNNLGLSDSWVLSMYDKMKVCSLHFAPHFLTRKGNKYHFASTNAVPLVIRTPQPGFLLYERNCKSPTKIDIPTPACMKSERRESSESEPEVEPMRYLVEIGTPPRIDSPSNVSCFSPESKFEFLPIHQRLDENQPSVAEKSQTPLTSKAICSINMNRTSTSTSSVSCFSRESELEFVPIHQRLDKNQPSVAEKSQTPLTSKGIRSINMNRTSTSEYISPQKYLKLKARLLKKNIQMRNLRSQIKRKCDKATSLNDMLKKKENERLVAEECENEEVPTIMYKLYTLNKSMKKSTKIKYSEEFKTFASTLHLYSPKAYNYVRKVFKCALPHTNTLSRWTTLDKTAESTVVEPTNFIDEIAVDETTCV